MELSSLSLLCSSLAGAVEGLGCKEGGCQQTDKGSGVTEGVQNRRWEECASVLSNGEGVLGDGDGERGSGNRSRG